jgi:hypothetical protein
LYKIDGELDKKEKTELVTRYQSEVDVRRRRIQMLKSCCQRDIKNKLHYAISLISNLEMLMEEAHTYVKQGILGSIFPQKLYFEKNKYRTPFLNSVVKIIYQETKSLRGSKKEKEDSKNWMSSSVPCRDTLLNPFSESLLDDLDRLWELKTILPDPSDPPKLYKN